MAVAAYHLLLRTGEMFGVRRCDLTSNAGGAVGVVALGLTKASQRQGNASSVRVADLAVALILRDLATNLAPGDKLIHSSQGAWRTALNVVLKALGIEHLHIRGYSLRRGGATTHFRRTASFDSTVERGRWASLSTARKYLDDAVATTASIQVPEFERAQLAILASEFVQFVIDLIGEKAMESSLLFSDDTRTTNPPPAPEERQDQRRPEKGWTPSQSPRGAPMATTRARHRHRGRGT